MTIIAISFLMLKSMEKYGEVQPEMLEVPWANEWRTYGAEEAKGGRKISAASGGGSIVRGGAYVRARSLRCEPQNAGLFGRDDKRRAASGGQIFRLYRFLSPHLLRFSDEHHFIATSEHDFECSRHVCRKKSLQRSVNSLTCQLNPQFGHAGS
ncbi:MAG TPA: hypothetical protein VN982_01870 [Candidatus Dormibacteraeota bacterium]|nr:hypothetical protein [Candidatus Dormibacteraeota bacterium]